MISGSAGGASTSNGGSKTTISPHLAAPQSGSTSTTGVVYHTVGTNVNLRTGASPSSSVLTVMTAQGSPVTLTCYLRGTSIAGDPWWYQGIFVSARGYVSGFWVNTGPDPAKTHLPAC